MVECVGGRWFGWVGGCVGVLVWLRDCVGWEDGAGGGGCGFDGGGVGALLQKGMAMILWPNGKGVG